MYRGSVSQMIRRPVVVGQVETCLLSAALASAGKSTAGLLESCCGRTSLMPTSREGVGRMCHRRSGGRARRERPRTRKV